MRRKEYLVKSIIQMVLQEGIVDYITIADELGISKRKVSYTIMTDMKEMYPEYFKKVVKKLNEKQKLHHVEV